MKFKAERRFVLLVLVFVFSISLNAFAGLGEDESIINSDGQGFRALNHTIKTKNNIRLHTLNLKDGTIFKEYVSNGVVFAVSWQNCPLRPNFSRILGKHFGEYQAHAGEVPRAAGHRFRTLKTENAIITIGGHMGSHGGYAYIAALVPPGFDPNETYD